MNTINQHCLMIHKAMQLTNKIMPHASCMIHKATTNVEQLVPGPCWPVIEHSVCLGITGLPAPGPAHTEHQ